MRESTENRGSLSHTSEITELADVKPGKVTRTAVVGMGTMGTGIAQVLIQAGLPVVVLDELDAALIRGLERLQNSLGKRVEQGRLSRQDAEKTLGLVRTTTDWSALGDADLVIEAVIEDAETKRSVIRRLEEACGDQAVIATNTSTISLEVLGHSMQRPGRLVGLHFFNPAQRMPLVEVITWPAASPGVVATAVWLVKTLRKTPVLVKSREGFLVNRLLIPYWKEAFWLLEEGAEPEVIDAAAVEFGFPMGPLAVVDMAGLDILVSTDRVLREAFPRHGPLSAIATRLAEDGHLGQKTGRGVYQYEPGDYTPHESEAAKRIIAEVCRQASRPEREISPDEITRRLVLRMVAEAFYVLEEGIARNRSDVDAAMVLGCGFPDFRGGVITYADDIGLDAVLDGLDQLTAACGERFSPCPLLHKMKGAKHVHSR